MKLPFRRHKAVDYDPSNWPWFTTPPPEWLTGGTGTSTLIGLPALFAVLRLIASAASMVPLFVYRRTEPGAPADEARDTWQWELLHRRPALGTTSASWRADLAGSLAANGNYFGRKLRVNDPRFDEPRIGEILTLDPRKVEPKREGGVIVYHDNTGEKPIIRAADEIIHIRTFAEPMSLRGYSPVAIARDMIETALRRQRFEGRYYVNDARPGIAIKFGELVGPDTAKRWVEMLEAEHRGAENAWRPLVIGGGAEITPFPVSLEDAQFVEAARLTIQEIAGIYQVPKAFVGEGGSPTPVDAWFLKTFCLGPLMAVTDEALSFDAQLFPAEDDSLYAEHMMDALLRPDTKDRYDAYRLARQGGWITPNEIRKRENLPEVSGGDEIQVTPVGGAPNQ